MLQDFFNNKKIIFNFFNKIVHNSIFIDQCLDLRLDTNKEKGGFSKLTFKIRKRLTSIPEISVKKFLKKIEHYLRNSKDNFLKNIYVYALKTEIIIFLKKILRIFNALNIKYSFYYVS